MLKSYRIGEPFHWARLLALVVLLLPLAGWGQTFFPLSGGNYSENFANISGWTDNFASGTGAQYYRVAASVPTSLATQTQVFVTSTTGGVQKGTGTIVLLATGTNSVSNVAAFDLALDFSGRTPGTLSFDYAKVQNGAAGTRVSALKVQYSTDNGATFTTLAGSATPVVSNSATAEGGTISIAIPAALAGESQVYFRFYVSPNGDNTGGGNRPKISIDNITISSTSATPNCAGPGAPAFSGTTSTSTAVAFAPNANNTGPYTVTAVPASGTTVTATGSASPITLTGLAPGTSYTVSVTGTCTAASGGGASSPSATATVTTLPVAPTLTSINPTSITAGQTTTVVFTGTGFASGATVNFNGTSLSTTVTNATTLSAAIPAPASATTATFPVSVTTPGGTTGTQTLTVTPAATCFAPTNVAAGSPTTTTASISFTGDASATGGYIVTATPQGGGTAITNAGSASPIALSGLAPSTTYNVTVASDCGGGQTATSSPAVAFTTQAVVPNPEINVQVAGVDYLTGSTYAFGTTTVGTPVGPVTFTVQNTSTTDALTVSGVGVTSSSGGGFSVAAGATPFTVAAGSTAAFTASFNPTSTGAKTGVITITNNDQNESSYVINLTGSANPTPPALTAASPTNVLVGISSPVILTGTGLTSSTTVNFNGTSLTPSTTSTTSVTARIVAPSAGTFPVSVTNSSGTSNTVNVTATNPPAGFFEPFEADAQSTYVTTAGGVSLDLTTGTWTLFQGLLLNNDANDKKNNAQSVRLRGGGTLAMAFDKANGAGVVTVNAAMYGTDTNTGFTLQYSTNGGTTYTTVPGTPTTLTSTLTPYPFTLNVPGNVRLRLASTNTNSGNNPRIDLDDIQISDYAAPVACSAPSTPTFSNITQTTASVVLTPGTNGGTTFTVTATPTAGGSPIIATGTSPVSLGGLTAGTSYSVTARSDCNAGFSSPSATSAAATLTTTAAPTASLAVTQGATSYPSGGTAYSFGNQTLATTSAPVTFTLTNSGTAPLTISGITTTGDFAVSGAVPTTVAANGGTATVSVTFTPTTLNTRTGTLVVNSDASNAATYTVNLTGTGTAVPAPEIDVQQSSTGTSYASGSTFSGFPTTTVGSFSPVSFTVLNTGTAALTISSIAPNGDFSIGASTGAPYVIPAGGSLALSFIFGPTAPGTRTGSVTLTNNDADEATYVINLSGNATPAALPDLTVTTGTPTSPTPISGNYNNVTIAPGGNAVVSGPLTVAGALTVQPTGLLIQNCQSITGSGSFVLQAGGALAICDPAGIYAVGALGAIRVAGTRTYSSGAAYIYNGTAAQVTGPALPAQVAGLGVNNAAGLTLSQAVAVSQQVTLQVGNLDTGGQTFTLLSSAAGTAVLDNGTQGSVVNGAATVQRYINSANAIGYRHYSAPVSNTTVNDLATSNFTPTFNTSYNTVADPSLVTPFPTVFGYDQNRVSTVSSTYVGFDKGWFSPVPGAPMTPNLGYTVNAPNTALVDFVGTLNNGNQSATGLTYTGTGGGWQLLGNPYPAPLDWSTVGIGQRPGMEAAMYVFQSSGQYGGSYRSYTNGIGGSSPLIPTASGYFVRVATVGGIGAVNLTNANRVTTFGTQPAFGRGTVDVRPQLQLQLSGAGTGLDEAYVYFESGATAGHDVEYDATKLANPSGLNLASLAGAEQMAINGLPALGAAPVLVPLFVGVPAAGSYQFQVAKLANFTGTVTLVDALTGTRTVLSTGSSYAFTLTGYTAPGRFTLEFGAAAGPLATAAQVLAAQVQLFPNPASASFRVQLPVRSAKAVVSATLVNALGQTVQQRTLSAPAGQAIDAEFDVRGLAAGVYQLRLSTDGAPVVRKVVVQ
jgi:hypothetical protein